MADEGFREIQLSPKTLVALFMAAAVIAVVVFLCGVMVGRGVRAAAPVSATVEAPPPAPVPDAPPAADETAGKQPAATPASTSTAAPSPASVAPPTPPPEDVGYYGRLEGTHKEEAVKKPATPAQHDSKAVAAASKVATGQAAAEPQSNTWTVQVGAYGRQSQADAVVKHLKSKGYDVYVPTPAGDGMYKVRVGRFKDRKEAETVKNRIEKEEQYKPWITR